MAWTRKPQFLKSQEIKDSAIVAFELNKTLESLYAVPPDAVQHEVSRKFKLTIDDLTQYDTIANTLFNMNNVINIDTTFYRRDFSQIESDLQTAACADAKNKAVALAAGFGGEVGDVYCISQDGFDGIFETFMFNTANSGYSPAGVWGDFMAKDNSQPTLTSSPLNPRGATKPNFLA